MFASRIHILFLNAFIRECLRRLRYNYRNYRFIEFAMYFGNHILLLNYAVKLISFKDFKNRSLSIK